LTKQLPARCVSERLAARTLGKNYALRLRALAIGHRTRRTLCGLVVVLSGLGGGQCFAQQTATVPDSPSSGINASQPRELRQLRAYKEGERPEAESLERGQTHSYKLNLESGFYFRVQAGFDGFDAGMTLYGPDGSTLEEVTVPTSISTQKFLMWTTSVPGVYRLEIRSLNMPVAPGHYAVQIVRLLPLNAENEHLIKADQASFEGYRLKDTGTEEGLRAAIPKLESAIPHWDLVGDRDDSLYAEYEAMMYLGEIHFFLSEYEKSLGWYRRAWAVRERPGWNRHDNWVENNTARSYEMLGDTEKALKYFQLSVASAEKLPAEENHKDRGVAYAALAAFYLKIGEKQKAIEYLNKSLPMWRIGSHNVHGAFDIDGEARSALWLGRLHASLGDSDLAIDCFKQSASVWRSTSDLVWLPRALDSLGQVQFQFGDFPAALATFKEGLEISKRSGSGENEGYGLANVGQVELSLGSYQDALGHLQQALALTESIGNRGGEAYVLSMLGLLARAQGNSAGAIDYFNKTIRLREATLDREGTADALYQLAVTQRDLGDLEAAEGNIRRALDLIEFVRSSFQGQEMRSGYLSNTRKYYELNIDLLMRMHERNPSLGFDAQAFEASEQARARNLLETLFASGKDIRQGVPDALLQRERAVEQRLKAKSEYQTRLLSRSRTREEERQAAKDVSDLTDEWREIQAAIRVASPRYAELTQPQPLTLKEIQAQALDPDTVLLEYAFGEDLSFLWLVTDSSISSFPLSKRSEIEDLARRSYLNIGAPAANSRKGDEAVLALSQILFGPVADRLKNKRLVIVAEGALQYVPFAALPSPVEAGRQRPPLIAEQYEIVSLPSASSLVLLRREIKSRPAAPRTVATLADPVFESSDPRVRHSQETRVRQKDSSGREGARTLAAINFNNSLRDAGSIAGRTIQRLPSTRREAMAIAALVPARQRKIALDFEANRTTALSGALSGYRILHFATHGLLDSQRPELSGLVLSLVDRNGRPRDGFLQVHEIYNLKLPADLVVLSACQTALGKDVKGEGLIGVTRGFMYAGAARVVSSLWEVDSRATAELMRHFYREMLRNKLSPAAALRAAQLSMTRDPRWHSPYYWAGFIIQGEYR
jgi:CHAT domain-containing protein